MSVLDSKYSGLDKAYDQTNNPITLRTADDVVRDRNARMGVTAVNRASNGFIGSPSGTDWAKTFGRNTGLNDSGSTSSGQSSSFTGNRSPFSFDLSPFSGNSQLNLGTDATDFYRERTSNFDITKRDHELYGAGSDYGFAF